MQHNPSKKHPTQKAPQQEQDVWSDPGGWGGLPYLTGDMALHGLYYMANRTHPLTSWLGDG